MIATRIEHEGNVLNIPRTPPGFQGYQVLNDARKSSKLHIAERVMEYCLERAKVEVAAHIRRDVEERGLDAIYRLMYGGQVIRTSE